MVGARRRRRPAGAGPTSTVLAGRHRGGMARVQRRGAAGIRRGGGASLSLMPTLCASMPVTKNPRRRRRNLACDAGLPESRPWRRGKLELGQCPGGADAVSRRLDLVGENAEKAASWRRGCGPKGPARTCRRAGEASTLLRRRSPGVEAAQPRRLVGADAGAWRRGQPAEEEEARRREPLRRRWRIRRGGAEP